MKGPLAEFAYWLLKPRGSFIYHKGFLLLDRYKLFAGLVHVPEEPIHGLASMAWNAQSQGKVALVQRRLGAGCYEYIAQGKERA